MNNNNDYDYEQVFIVSDTDDFNSNNRTEPVEHHYGCNYNKNSASVKDANDATGFIFIGLIIFLPMAMIAFFGSLIAKMNDLSFSVTGVPFMCAYLLVIMYVIGKMFQSKNIKEREVARATANARIRSKSKKVQKIAGYQHLPPPLPVPPPLPMGPSIPLPPPPPLPESIIEREKAEKEKKEEEQKKNDDIELAVEALVRLGFGIRKAKEWIGRGVESGILESDTQGLIKFALKRGA